MGGPIVSAEWAGRRREPADELSQPTKGDGMTIEFANDDIALLLKALA
jgi:hypothetical protein